MPKLPVLVSGRFLSGHEAEFTAPAEAEPLSRILKRPIRKEALDRILEAFEEATGLLESYLLDKEKLWWDPSWVFYDTRESRICLVYLPWEEDPGKISIEKQLCRYLWHTAAAYGWGTDLWESIGRYSVKVFGPKERKEQKPMDPEKEKALDDLMEGSSFLPPLDLRGNEETGKYKEFIPRLKAEIHSILHGW